MIRIECQGLERSFPLVIPGVEAIFFDKDGTLSRSEDYLKRLGQDRAKAIDALAPGSQEAILRCFGFRAVDQFQELDPTGLLPVGSGEENRLGAAGQLAAMGYPWFECLRITQEAFQAVDENLPPFYTLAPIIPGVADCFQQLAQLPVKVAVVSGDTTPNIEKFLDYHQLTATVDGVRGADIPPRKPDPDCFWQMCDRLGVNPEAVVMVGDATGDMAMAQAAGAAAGIGVLWGWSLPHQIDQADVIVDRWEQLSFKV
ncbi:MAG: HAD family hydrolase [Prochlorotrichaceae cyanobacterium]